MGSLESGSANLKRDPAVVTLRSSRNPFLQRQRSRFSRFFLFKKLDYLQWTCTVVIFLFLLFFSMLFLPGSVDQSPMRNFNSDREFGSEDLAFLKEYGILDFGEDIARFELSKVLEKFRTEERELVSLSSHALNRTRLRYPHRKPQLALVKRRRKKNSALNFFDFFLFWVYFAFDYLKWVCVSFVISEVLLYYLG